jgi:hypothetical protein
MGAAHVEPLAELYRILKLVFQRSSSSPALRLLDDVLFILGDDLGVETYSSRCARVGARMCGCAARAFKLGEQAFKPSKAFLYECAL